MKKLLAMISCILIFALLAGCQGTMEPTANAETEAAQPSGSQAPETEPLETQPTDVAPPAEKSQPLYSPEEIPDAYVVDLYRGIHLRQDGTEDFDAIPFVCLPGAQMEVLNLQIQSWCSYTPELFANATAGEFDYTWHITGDFLIILLSYDYFGAYTDYEIFNVRISTCSLADDEEILAAAGVNREEFEAQLPKLVSNALFDALGEDGCAEYFGDLENYSWPIDMFTDTTETWLEHIKPYLNENGELCFRAYIARPAGSGCVDELLRYEPEAPYSPYYAICEDYLKSTEDKAS